MLSAVRSGIWRRALLRAAFLVVLVSTASASALEDYQSRLTAAHQTIDELIGIDPSMSGLEGFQRGKADEIRKELPAQEIVEWLGGSVAVDNSWLHGELDAYTAEANLSKQKVVLTRIAARLDAIESVAIEAQESVSGERSKDEDKRKLAEILSRQEFEKPQAESESLFQRLRRQLIEWLSKMFPSVNVPAPDAAEGLGSLAKVLQFLLYAALAAGILFLLYRFVPYFSGRAKKGKKSPENERVILGERITDDISAADLFVEAERLARDGELRLAIRKGYVALLCELNDRKLIGLARHKTNRDYLRDLRPRMELFEGVRGLTGSFERHWYGSQASVEQDWEEFRSLYRETLGRT